MHLDFNLCIYVIWYVCFLYILNNEWNLMNLSQIYYRILNLWYIFFFTFYFYFHKSNLCYVYVERNGQGWSYHSCKYLFLFLSLFLIHFVLFKKCIFYKFVLLGNEMVTHVQTCSCCLTFLNKMALFLCFIALFWSIEMWSIWSIFSQLFFAVIYCAISVFYQEKCYNKKCIS